MFRRFRSPLEPEEDPAVAAVEQIFTRAVPSESAVRPRRKTRPSVTNALWICACITRADAPTWLIYDMPDGRIAWCRVPDKVEALELVNARSSAGGHADPAEVPRWLRGEASDPWQGLGDGSGEPSVLEEIRRRVGGADRER